MTSLAAALSKKTVSATGIWALASATSAPMAVLLAIVSIYAGTALRSLPLLFLIVGGVVALLLAGYSAMIREVPHSAVYYAVTARGIGPRSGVAAGMVAVVSYLAIQCCLFGLVGPLVSSYLPGPWWLWALVSAACVYLFGRRTIVHSTRVVLTVLVLSLLVLVAVVVVSLAHPANGRIDWGGFSTTGLWAPDLALAIGLTVACFTGIDGGGAFVEEEDSEVSGRAVGVGMMASAGLLTVLYAAAAAAMGVTVGLSSISGAAQDDPFLPVSLLDRYLGAPVAGLAVVVLVAAVVASQTAFHAMINRYLFAMGRELVLPQWLAREGTGKAADSSVAGSRVQTVIAVATIGVFALSGGDPSLVMFNWLALGGAMGLLALLVVSNVAAAGYFSRHRTAIRSVWTGRLLPGLGVVLGAGLLLVMLVELGSLLGGGTSFTPYLLPVGLIGAGVAGYARAAYLRRYQPDVFTGISHGVPGDLDVPASIPNFF